IAVSPYFANDRTLFAGGAFGGLFKHDGTSWSKVNAGLSERWVWIRSIVLSPRFPDEPKVYVGTRSGVYRSIDGGTRWVLITPGLPDFGAMTDTDRGVKALAISPDFGNDRTIFAGIWKGNIYRLRD
ncbi:MAG: hypothetical protein HW403_841, partial [Dehalococcoidia bacterium]|nr:hypothetical protein [Dehalococcoidia bacterium]